MKNNDRYFTNEEVMFMLNRKTIAVVVPAYNEETQIGIVIDTMPEFVDRIIVVNDSSTDKTSEIVRGYIEREKHNSTEIITPISREIKETFFNRAEVVQMDILNEEDAFFHPHEVYNNNTTDRIVLIDNLKNGRIGKALSVGYKWARDHGIDCTAVMAGDAQMDPDELLSICSPVLEQGIDYVKGNRLSHKSAKKMVPKKRHFGNSVLSALTKISSGYWRISDTQTGYTAMSLNALNSIDLFDIYRTYGCPNDILIKLNIANCTLREIPIKPVYAVGEKSKMKIAKVIPRISWLLIKGYFKRIVKKYLLKDFHPIFVFYFVSWLSALGLLYFLGYIIVGLVIDNVSLGTYFGFVALLISCFVTMGFGMWLDIYDNERLLK